MDILPLLTLLLQAKGGAGAPPQGEAALARLVSALNAPARGEQAAGAVSARGAVPASPTKEHVCQTISTAPGETGCRDFPGSRAAPTRW